MFPVLILIGCLPILSGAISVITGKNILWKSGAKKYTEDSLEVYTRLSGILHIVIGISLILIFTGSRMSLLLKWAGISILWLSVATNITLYLITLVKK